MGFYRQKHVSEHVVAECVLQAASSEGILWLVEGKTSFRSSLKELHNPVIFPVNHPLQPGMEELALSPARLSWGLWAGVPCFREWFLAMPTGDGLVSLASCTLAGSASECLYCLACSCHSCCKSRPVCNPLQFPDWLRVVLGFLPGELNFEIASPSLKTWSVYCSGTGKDKPYLVFTFVLLLCRFELYHIK